MALGSKSVEIELQKEHVFAGQLKDIASPYLGVAAVISLGAGAACLSMSGWRKSSSKSAQTEEQLSKLQQDLKDKETQLEELRLSELHLQATGLNTFLDPADVQILPLVAESAEVAAPQPIAVAAAVEVVKPPKPVVQEAKVQNEIVPHHSLPRINESMSNHAMPKMVASSHSVQGFVNAAAMWPAQEPVVSSEVRVPISAQATTEQQEPIYMISNHQAISEAAPSASAQPQSFPTMVEKTPAEKTPAYITAAEMKAAIAQRTTQFAQSRVAPPTAALAQVSTLQNQLQQIATQIETLQSSLQDTPDSSQTPDSSTQLLEQLERRLQQLESERTRQPVASRDWVVIGG
ncbi:MAG TPA: hypothetical protein V6D18_10985 [Thermosynechococcaceae cyanobacterium]